MTGSSFLRARGHLAAGGSLLAAVVLAGCAASGGASNTAQNPGITVASTSSAVSGPAVASPTLSVTPGDGAIGVAVDAAVSVRTDSGVLDRVALHSDADLTPLAGALSSDLRTWTSSATLEFGSHYLLRASAHDSGGSVTAQAGFTTMATPAGNRLTTEVTPADGSTVGVGMPIILKFNTSVASARQTIVVSHITVQTTTPIVGAWHWFGDQEVHWRPKDYWPSGTQVQIIATLRGVGVGGGYWGLGNWTSSFTIGPKHVSIIDAAAHQMQVFSNGTLIHTYPVSTGKPSSPTLTGTLFVWYKLQSVRMVSTSIGIPVNSPGGYDEKVFWDTAISTDGFYIHSAPWSVASQGHVNVSHGCVNLSPARATEFFGFSQVGDVVQVVNTSRVADASDGEADWQIPFDQFANSGGAAAPAPVPAPAGGGGL